ncbi:rab3 GTPase-activating protein non-catalytic subunit-like [Gopherus evgoodei]|uniref:rab3 GTPase-activating protein non-catalytic subunit-like n=1 Tax=Gopherus evgoodei TaxID=1825980 RepID=UPI0011CF05A2|nr:rab3 GTPase-activating protein non-catalytic subunit-like [Gopherus evgoodei]
MSCSLLPFCHFQDLEAARDFLCPYLRQSGAAAARESGAVQTTKRWFLPQTAYSQSRRRDNRWLQTDMGEYKETRKQYCR